MAPSQKDNKRPSALCLLNLHLGFILTGVSTTLLGCVLPVLGDLWHMNDSRTGVLLAAQFAGSSFGALLVQRSLYVSVIRGYLLLIMGAILVAFCHGQFAPPLFFVFGLGMGLAMTATSILVGSISIMNRGSALSLLDAAWCLGAVLSPIIATVWLGHRSSASLFLALGLLTLVPVLFLVSQHRQLSRFCEGSNGSLQLRCKLSLHIPLAVLAFLYVGVEASISSWMMTFVHRLHIPGTNLAPTATSIFWIALLCGRTAVPAILRKITESRLLTISLSLTFISNVLLIVSHTSAMSLTSALLAGLMLAPIFPLCLAKVLAITGQAFESKWVFGFSGLGGALFPWLTGQLAVAGGSLRTGLMVPLLASCLMLLLHLRTRPLLVALPV